TEHYYGKVENKEAGTQRLTALVRPHLRGGSLNSIAVRLAAETSKPQVGASGSASISQSPDVLDNGLIRVRVSPNGTVDITDRATGECFPGLNRIIDEVDRGDLYEHARTLTSSELSALPGRLTVTEASPLRATVRVETEIECNGIKCP